MKSRICICCGEPMPEAGNALSRNPNICASCSSLADGMEDGSASDICTAPSGPDPGSASTAAPVPEGMEEGAEAGAGRVSGRR
jgi:hypothetical protein